MHGPWVRAGSHPSVMQRSTSPCAHAAYASCWVALLSRALSTRPAWLTWGVGGQSLGQFLACKVDHMKSGVAKEHPPCRPKHAAEHQGGTLRKSGVASIRIQPAGGKKSPVVHCACNERRQDERGAAIS